MELTFFTVGKQRRVLEAECVKLISKLNSSVLSLFLALLCFRSGSLLSIYPLYCLPSCSVMLPYVILVVPMHAQVFETTLVSEVHIFHSHTEWNFISSLNDNSETFWMPRLLANLFIFDSHSEWTLHFLSTTSILKWKWSAIKLIQHNHWFFSWII